MRAEVLLHPMWGKGLPGTALPRALPSVSGFPREQQVLEDRMGAHISERDSSLQKQREAFLSLGCGQHQVL